MWNGVGEEQGAGAVVVDGISVAPPTAAAALLQRPASGRAEAPGGEGGAALEAAYMQPEVVSAVDAQGGGAPGGQAEKQYIDPPVYKNRQSSAIWKFCRLFKPADDGGPNVECFCPVKQEDGTEVQCGQLFKLGKDKSTGNLVRHFFRHHQEEHKYIVSLSSHAKKSKDAGGVPKAPVQLLKKQSAPPRTQPLTKIPRHRGGPSDDVLHHARRYMRMCCWDMLQWDTCSGAGFRTWNKTEGGVQAMQACTRGAFERLLLEEHDLIKKRIQDELADQRVAVSGPFAGLQLDAKDGPNDTAHVVMSATIVTPTFQVRRMCLAYKQCPKPVAPSSLAQWVREIVHDYVPGAEPDQVFLQATVGPDDSCAGACMELGLEVQRCVASRFDAAVDAAMGLGMPEAHRHNGKNPRMREFLGRVNAMTHCIMANPAHVRGIGAVQDSVPSRLLAHTRLRDETWHLYFQALDRTLELKPATQAHLSSAPADPANLS